MVHWVTVGGGGLFRVLIFVKKSMIIGSELSSRSFPNSLNSFFIPNSLSKYSTHEKLKSNLADPNMAARFFGNVLGQKIYLSVFI